MSHDKPAPPPLSQYLYCSTDSELLSVKSHQDSSGGLVNVHTADVYLN